MTGSRHSRPAIVWLQMLLIGGLACVVILLVQSFRLARSNQSVVERALRDYADFAAWSYAQHLSSDMREAVDELLGAVNHGEGLHTGRRVPDARDMGHFLPEDPDCNCHRTLDGPLPRRFLAFTLGADTLAVGPNFAPEKLQGWLADSLDSRALSIPVRKREGEETRWLNRLLTEVARGPESNWGYHVTIDRREDEPRFIATRLMPTEWGDTVVYAVEYPPADLDWLFEAVLSANDLLPAAIVEGRANRDMLDLEVLDAMGAPLFRHGQERAWDFDATARLPASYGGLLIRAHLRYDMAEAILIGGVPKSRVPILLVILALALGLTLLAAVQLRREVRFAAERATFVANVSHELRTPLSQIRLAVDTLRLGRARDADSGDHALAVADREALRLQHLVEGVLRFSRGSHPADEPRHPTDAAQEARAVVSEFEALATPHRVTVELTAATPLLVALHRGALRQMLLNLFDNAVKYGGDGTAIRVRLEARPAGGVRLIVDDNGPGVPPAERDRIWRPFERGGVARRRAAGGSGIGLTIVREIAGEHGGAAWVEDAPGGGARFIVDLPDEGGA